MLRWLRPTFTMVLAVGLYGGLASSASAQTVATPSEAECQSLRQRLAEHARLSEGVRRAVAAQAAASPTVSGGAAASAPAPAPTGRAATIRARLEQIPKEHQTLEDQRIAAVVKFDFGRVANVQTQMQALETEKSNLERELSTLPATPAAPAAASPAPTPPSDAARIRCQDVTAAIDNAVKTRRRELGAKEDQAGAVPLIALKGQSPEQIGQELVGQLGTTASSSVGLLDSDGNGQLDGIVDVPAPGVFRLLRQRADGTLTVETFPAPGSGTTGGYGEMTRRLDETTIRQSGQNLAGVLGTRQAGPARVTQTGDFAPAYTQFQAGNFADAAKLTAPAARSAEYQNLRGQSVRVIEILSPVSGGVSLRRAVVVAQPNDQELWEETTTIVRPVSYWRTDIEQTRSRETRTAAGAVVGTPATATPSKFSLER
jgi:hypothetical protein